MQSDLSTGSARRMKMLRRGSTEDRLCHIILACGANHTQQRCEVLFCGELRITFNNFVKGLRPSEVRLDKSFTIL